MKERLDDLHDSLLEAINKLNEAALALDPLEALSKTITCQWGTVQEAQERVTEIMEKIEWAQKRKQAQE
jgi:uncharacterized coiled-coil protein SlyX